MDVTPPAASESIRPQANPNTSRATKALASLIEPSMSPGRRPVDPAPTSRAAWRQVCGDPCFGVRLLALLSALTALGLGGVALAQPQLVVDPWPRSANGARAAVRSPMPARSSPAPTEIRDPWGAQPDGRGDSAPDAQIVSRIASGLDDAAATALKPAATRTPIVSRIASGLDDAAAAALKPAATRTQRLATWSARFNEIVAPWQHMPRLAVNYDATLIVDPWAASTRRAQRQPRQ
jgi:hypothetical protein